MYKLELGKCVIQDGRISRDYRHILKTFLSLQKLAVREDNHASEVQGRGR